MHLAQAELAEDGWQLRQCGFNEAGRGARGRAGEVWQGCIPYPTIKQQPQAAKQHVAAKHQCAEQTCEKVRKAFVARFMAWFQRCTSGGPPPPPPPAALLSFTLMLTCSLLLLVSCQSKTADGNCLQLRGTSVTER